MQKKIRLFFFSSVRKGGVGGGEGVSAPISALQER